MWPVVEIRSNDAQIPKRVFHPEYRETFHLEIENVTVISTFWLEIVKKKNTLPFPFPMPKWHFQVYFECQNYMWKKCLSVKCGTITNLVKLVDVIRVITIIFAPETFGCENKWSRNSVYAPQATSLTWSSVT